MRIWEESVAATPRGRHTVGQLPVTSEVWISSTRAAGMAEPPRRGDLDLGYLPHASAIARRKLSVTQFNNAAPFTPRTSPVRKRREAALTEAQDA